MPATHELGSAEECCRSSVDDARTVKAENGIQHSVAVVENQFGRAVLNIDDQRLKQFDLSAGISAAEIIGIAALYQQDIVGDEVETANLRIPDVDREDRLQRLVHH
ncbi:hypothetical protein [Qipengyuania sp.]|uniref:hypothetical protein n=1 Tax=Qipengyuania sp. TaxID=2004515 RepID=UPI003BA8679D